MSSCKLWRDRQLGRSCDKTCREASRNVTPSLLRLDSTGEVSSIESTSGQTTKMCHGKKGSCFSCKRPQHLSLQSVVNSLGMSTVIDTANSYLNSASSYIESVYSPKSSMCLVDGRSTVDCTKMDLGNMFQRDNNMSSVSSRSEGALWPHMASTSYSKGDGQVNQGIKKAWTQEILGALQSSVFSRDKATNPHKPERYIPPPFRNRQLQEKKCNAAFIDPKLTPYNAKLLQKSKHKDIETTKSTLPVRTSKDGNRSCSISADVKSEGKTTNSSLPCVSNNQTQNIPDINSIDNTVDLIEDLTNRDMESGVSVTDWFEYENQNENIPVDVCDQLLKSVSTDVPAVPDNKGPDLVDVSQDRMLHSWYSMDNDAEIKKTNSTKNIPSSACSSSQRSCDSFEHPVTNGSSHPGKNTSAEHKYAKAAGVNHPEIKPECSKESNSSKTNNAQKKQHEDSDKKHELISVLYIRNGTGPKRRPSAQKRSKHKAQKNLNVLKNQCKNTSKPLKEGNAFHPNSSVAFILGLDHQQSDSCFSMQSFQVSCDIEDLDWSSCDENDSDLEDFSCDDFDLFSPLKSLVNFQVTCSIPTQTTNSSGHDLLERINLEWELNISLPSDCQRSASSKKVQFKEDQHLATVYPMIAWSYAYQAARKGPWEEIARDRGRFQRRITDGEKLLQPVLDIKHRDRVFKERFE